MGTEATVFFEMPLSYHMISLNSSTGKTTKKENE